MHIEDGKKIYKETVPAETAKAAEKYCEGNGEIIKVKDITEETLIDAVAVAYALSSQGSGETEIRVIFKLFTHRSPLEERRLIKALNNGRGNYSLKINSSKNAVPSRNGVFCY